MGGLGEIGPFKKLLRANLFLSFGFSASAAAPILLCSSWIMGTYGRGFRAGGPVLTLLVLATVLSSTAAVVGQAIMSVGKMWWAYSLNLVWALVLLGCAIQLVPRYGALGLAGAFLTAYAVNALTVSIYARVLFGKRR